MGEQTRRLIGWAVTAALAAVVIVGFVLGDPTPADRVQAIGRSIMCPVCQGEAIADSPSETAEAMMAIVEEKVAAGETDQQIISYFQARYGEGILLDPPFSGKTLLVWLLPLVAVGGGVWMILTRRRTTVPSGTTPP